MILVIDNYDSFTYNVVQSLERLSTDSVKVVRSKEVTLDELIALNPCKLVISPGPGTPQDAGVSMDAIRYFAGKVPILGVCLGHQAIAEAFGAKIVQAKRICHGVVEQITLDGKGIFRNSQKKELFTRYHSLAIDEATLPEEFEITARANDGEIMGIRHKEFIIEGVQFHPESIASQNGDALFKAFLHYRRENVSAQTMLNQLLAKKDLTEEQASLFIENLTDGTLDERVTAAILTALSSKGESVSEMIGCAKALLKQKTPLNLSVQNLAEIVGTGGDGKGSFNISSLSAIVASSCGQSMAKHGNRAVSSKSGAADFFENLGINCMLEPAKTAKLIEKTGFGFLMAPVYHSAMRYAAPIRKVLGVKTIFNILGPLLNPASASYEVLGVYDKALLRDYARAAKALGAKRVMVVASDDGYDEISPCALTSVYQINADGKEYAYTINPQDFGITDAVEEELMGGDGAENANLAREVLAGKGRKTIRYAVALNAGAVLFLSGKAKTLKTGYNLALQAIDNGVASAKLAQIVDCAKAL